MSVFKGSAIECVRGGRRVFANLDFSLSQGEALVLVGPNGSGKSSLLRILAGLLAPASGELSWDGINAGEDPEIHHARLHYVGHLDALKPALSVKENLSFWTALRIGGVAPEGLIMSALAGFGLDHLCDVPARMLSAGQKRRLTLSRALASPAQIWLLDEPTVALDRDSISALEKAIANHRRKGGMIVVATHSEMALGRAQPLYMDRYMPKSGLQGLEMDL